MSSRITRSSARKPANPALPTADDDPPDTFRQAASSTEPVSRKRKASSKQNHPVDQDTPGSRLSPEPKRARKSKSQAATTTSLNTQSHRQSRTRASAAMSPSDKANPSDENVSTTPVTSGPSKKKSGKSKKEPSAPTDLPPTSASGEKREKASASKKKASSSKKKTPAQSSIVDEAASPGSPETKADAADDQDTPHDSPRHEDDDEDDEDEDLGDDPFSSGAFLGRHGGPSGLSSSLRALSGMMSGMTSRMRSLLESLKQKDDPTMQQLALQEISEVLLVSTEDNLAGHLSPEQYVKEFVTLMQPPDNGFENPEMMLLACRCIANLIEALPSATATVVYSGAVPVLLEKLLNIEFVDLAEQALTTLEKISAEFPSSIVREGGLTACLQYLDFFATSTQRTAVTTAANCCRNIPDDSFPVVKDVMPNLLNVLNSSDQRVVEQGALCVSRIVKSFERQDERLEQLMTADMLQSILRLLLPGSTNLVSAHIHTQFLRVLSITARASPRLAGELLKLNVTDTLYQVLTGVSPPRDDENVAQNIDSVVVMQALIHRPKDQVFETLNVICEMLPKHKLNRYGSLHVVNGSQNSKQEAADSESNRASKRVEMLGQYKNELRRFATVLLPTLTDAYSSTVNLEVRRRVLTAQLEMLLSLDQQILEEALRPVPYASFLASILSQQDHYELVVDSLHAAAILLQRLGPVYQYQFHREGVMAEIRKISGRSLTKPPVVDEKEATSSAQNPIAAPSDETAANASPAARITINAAGEDDDDSEGYGRHDSDDEDYDGDPGEDVDIVGDIGESSDDSSSSPSPTHSTDLQSSGPGGIADAITSLAKEFISRYENEDGADLRDKASQRLQDLNNLVSDIADYYEGDQSAGSADLFVKLAQLFEGDALESITSYELLSSNIVHSLLELFDPSKGQANSEARSAFVETFMSSVLHGSNIKISSGSSAVTPFSILVYKLQDLLSRAEHFEVLTCNSSASDSSRGSAASVLAKQVRIKLVAEGDNSGIPPPFKNIMVSIHAIATLKALDEYLRPRMSLSERSHAARHAATQSAATNASNMSAAASEVSRALLATRAASTPVPPHGAGLGSPSSAALSTRAADTKDDTAKPMDAPSLTPTSRKTARKAAKKQTPQATPSTPPPLSTSTSVDASKNHQALECADEAQLADDDDVDMTEGLDAVLGEFEEEMDDDEPDPSAVSMEVASTGKVTARQDDGTRVATPAQTPVPASSAAAARPSASSFARSLFSGRAMSYAAAIQAIPTDWHLEFSVNGQPVANDVTVYRAVHHSNENDASGRNVWSNVHTINFKRVPGPPAPDNSIFPTPASPVAGAAVLPQSLDKNPTTAAILRLLGILHDINANLDEIVSDGRAINHVRPEPLSQFVNTKLTAKMNRQLEEPLIVASNSLPTWSEDLARLYPFLFPFETRHLFLQSTSFGYSRSITRWQNAQSQAESRRERHRDDRPFLPRLQRQKVRISRPRLLESAIKVLELYGASPSILEVEYFEEVGTGLGPTLEFYSNVSKEFVKKKTHMWRENEANQKDDYAFGRRGLFPAPMSKEQLDGENGKRVLMLFRILGKFIARSMLDSRIVDVTLNPIFFRVGAGKRTVPLSLGAVKSVDEDLAKSLQTLKQFAAARKKIIERDTLTSAQKAQKISRIQVAGAGIGDMGLDFTLPGYPSVELIENGANTSVSIDNIGDYIDKVVEFTLDIGVKRQVEAFRAGFSQVFPYSALRAFTPDELCMLFGRVDEDWSMEGLTDAIKADHGYNLDSKSIRNLLQVMTELDPQSRRNFLQFVTGSPKLPIGGFKALTPMFTVVLRPSEPGHVPDEYLPSCMTCVNYLKLPDYSTIEVMHQKLGLAIREGQGAFHLS